MYNNLYIQFTGILFFSGVKKMSNLYLFCSAGMSSSILVEKMNKIAEERGLDFNIKYFTEKSIDSEASKADVIMLSPQIRYRQSEVAEKFADKIIYVIDMRDYGLLKAEAVIDECINLLSK